MMGGSDSSDTGVYRGVEVIFSETKLFQVHKQLYLLNLQK